MQVLIMVNRRLQKEFFNKKLSFAYAWHIRGTKHLPINSHSTDARFLKIGKKFRYGIKNFGNQVFIDINDRQPLYLASHFLDGIHVRVLLPGMQKIRFMPIDKLDKTFLNI